ncbi:MAG: 50S ribosomal protein L9 [Bryobacterales bacterium]|nr:50S ribosomal protein L9 [Bryobacteraceae bacterium]MDW8129551.1 50S ribosomal protein L9 [Bryobacterales bacterium]
MEVILRQDIEKLGSRGQIVNVADGYARNYLLPRKLAVPATEANKKIVEQERLAALRREAREKAEAEELARMLAGVTVRLREKAGEHDQLFGSVTALHIAQALAQQGFQIDRRKIQLEHPIKQLGEYKVPIRLHREVTIEIAVEVLREE